MAVTYKEIDSSTSMRLYALTKHQFAFVFMVFAISFAITLIIGIAGPGAITEKTQTAKEIGVPGNFFLTGPFLLTSADLTQFNQQIWLFCKLYVRGLPAHSTYHLKRDFYMKVKILGRGRDTSFRFISHAFENRSRHLDCSLSACEPIVIFHLGSIDYPMYNVNVTFFGLSLPEMVSVRSVEFTFKYFNDQFTQIQIWFRFVFLVLSFTVTCMYAHSLRRIPIREWCIEQRWMSALLPLLLLYNNPLFPLAFLVKSWVPVLIDSLFQSAFFAGLLMFWLCAYHGMRKTDRKFLTFYLPKIIIIGLLLAAEVTLLSWEKWNELRDPSYHYKVDTGNFMAMKIFFFVVGGVYVVYLVVLIALAYRDLRNMPYFDIRLKFLTLLMLLVLLISLVAFFLRYGTAVLQDNFVLEVTASYRNSAEFLTFYGLLNLYLYTMAFVYSPAKSSKERFLQADSTFSMVAESDEDVMYSRKEALKQKKTQSQDVASEDDLR